MSDGNDQNDGAAPDPERRVAFDSTVRAEVGSVLASSAFRKSPVIAKLLGYLVEQTLAGNSDRLKSYTVAVEALSRPTEFDANHDSYARVQMVRLRKMLESHYAQHGPVDRLCLYLERGHYKIRLGVLAQAYPQLYRPLSDTLGNSRLKDSASPAPENFQPAQPVELTQGEPLASISRKPYSGINSPGTLKKVAIAASVTAVTIVVFLFGKSVINANKSELSPVLALSPLNAAVELKSNSISRPLSATLADGLRRFGLSQLRIGENARDEEPISGRPSYRLDVQFIDVADDGNKIFLQLHDLQSDTLIWSKEALVGHSPEDLDKIVAPLAADINGPYGAIAAYDTILLRQSKKPGYPCILKYFSYLKTRDSVMESQVDACLAKPVKETRLLADVLAIRSFFALEKTHADASHDQAMVTARRFAREAISADPNNAYARFAMARLAYFDQDCKSARYFTKQALDANPNEPIILAVLASHAQRCGYPDAGGILDRALLVNGDGDTYSRLFLLLASIAQNQDDRIAEITDFRSPNDGNNAVNYYLSETLIAASKDDVKSARRYWNRFSDALAEPSTSNDEKLRHIILSRALRKETLSYLDKKRVFDS